MGKGVLMRKEQQPGAQSALTGGPGANLAHVIGRNIKALQARRQEEEKERSLQERIADAVTKFAGSMQFVYLHLVLFGAWITINLLPAVPRRWHFDPSFVILAMFASVEAIFLSTFVLISQNRMAALADRRADLDLQVSLLAEHEITRLVSLVSAMAGRMGVAEAYDPELAELERDVAPEHVLDEIERREQDVSNERH